MCFYHPIQLVSPGVLDGVSMIFGLHVMPAFPTGTVGFTEGVFSAASDNSAYRQVIPGCFLFIASGNEEKGTCWSLHNPHFRLDEDVLPIGVQLHIGFIHQQLMSSSR